MDTWRSKEDEVRSGKEEGPMEVVRIEPKLHAPKLHGSLMQPLHPGNGQQKRPSQHAEGDAAAPTEPSLALPSSRSSEAEPQPSTSDSERHQRLIQSLPPSPRTGCPTEAQIQALVEGHISNAEREMLSAHIDECNACLELVGVLADSSPRDSDDSFGTVWPTTIGRGALLAERFDVLHFVAKGGMGEVYEAFDRNLQERVALKTMLCTSGDTEATMQQLRDEVRLARRVAHRNVCRIHELHVHRAPEEQGATVQFLAMEFVPGETLKARLAEGPLPLAEVISIGRQLLDGLEAAHAAGVLHLDFKSQNVLLRAGSHPPEPVIMDFGLARAFEVEARLRTSERHVAGSAGYMSPEQIQCRPAGPRSDLYAFGVVLFEMLTGRLPFEGDTVASIMMKQLKSRTPLPSRVCPEVPESFDALVVHLLHRDPRSRPETVASTRQAFEACVRESEAPQRSRRRKKRLLAAVAVLCSLLGTLLWRATQPAGDTTTTRALRPSAAAAVTAPAPTPEEEGGGNAPVAEPIAEEILPLPPPSSTPEEAPDEEGAPPDEGHGQAEESSDPLRATQPQPKRKPSQRQPASASERVDMPAPKSTPRDTSAPEPRAKSESAQQRALFTPPAEQLAEVEGGAERSSRKEPLTEPNQEERDEPAPAAFASPQEPVPSDSNPPAPKARPPRQTQEPARAAPENKSEHKRKPAKPRAHPWKPGVPRDLL